MATMQTSWREERRRDRMAEAQISREAGAARVQARITESEARARLRRDQDAARLSDRRTARKQRAARWAARMAWLRGHVVDLLFVPVIVVPGILAWTAMAAYGSQVWGPAGVILPVFSEGAMWAFAGATTITRKRHPDRPLWHLRAGTAVFAGVGATLNFIHGLTAHEVAAGVGAGVVMALVSVAGVVAHQLITAGPRRTRADRAAARHARLAARRERAVRRAALRRTVAVLDADGGVHLVHEPGAVSLRRRWHGRASLEEVPGAPQKQPAAPPEVHSWPRPAPVLDAPAPAPALQEERAIKPVPSAPSDAPKSAPVKRASARQKPASDRAAKRARAERLLRANPAMSRAEVVAASGVSERTADRIRAELPRHLHIAEG